MFKLLLTPDQQNYSSSEMANVIRSELYGGPSRYRMDLMDCDITVECQFTLNPEKQQYFRSFYNYINRGADSFLIDLMIETSSLREYTAKFQPGSVRLNNVVGGARYVSKVTLEVERNVSGLNFGTTISNFVGDVTPGTYTTGIHHLKVLPDQQSFEITQDAAVTGTNFKAPQYRARKNELSTEMRSKMQFSLTAAEFNYLRAVYNEHVYQGKQLFVDMVHADHQVRTYLGHVIPGTWKLSSIKGGLFTVRWEMDVLPLEGNVDLVALAQTWEPRPFTTPVYPGDMNLDTPWVD